jgi:hypothetical protein
MHGFILRASAATVNVCPLPRGDYVWPVGVGRCSRLCGRRGRRRSRKCNPGSRPSGQGLGRSDSSGRIHMIPSSCSASPQTVSPGLARAFLAGFRRQGGGFGVACVGLKGVLGPATLCPCNALHKIEIANNHLPFGRESLSAGIIP